MSIFAAIAMMGKTVTLNGRSDTPLANSVLRTAQREYPMHPVKAPLAAAAGLGGPIKVRPIEAMLRLARCTAPLIPRDVMRLYQHWGWLRYLGAFDEDPAGQLCLSAAGAQVRGNQRRVMSEELGVGFGALLAEQWCRAQGFKGTIRFTDVDQVLRGGHPGVFDVHVQGRQPDYLIQAPSLSGRGGVSHRLLECKGTVGASLAVRQLARGATQLASISVNGRTPQGIAVSTVSAGDGVTYRAVDPGDDEMEWSLDGFDVEQARSVRNSARVTDLGVEIDAAGLFMPATALAIASLAAYAGSEVAEEWIPEGISARFGPPVSRRVTEDNDLGRFEGQELILPAPGSRGLLRVFQGVEENVLRGIVHRDLAEIEESQNAIAEHLPKDDGETQDGSTDTAEPPLDPERFASAVSSEGAILSLAYLDGPVLTR